MRLWDRTHYDTILDVSMKTVRRVAVNGVAFALVAAAGLSGPSRHTITLFGDSVCKSVVVCERNADIRPAADAMIAEQVAAFGPSCVDPAKFVGIPASVLVRNARLKDFDTGVVRVVGLDVALVAAKAGDVYVLKACGSPSPGNVVA